MALTLNKKPEADAGINCIPFVVLFSIKVHVFFVISKLCIIYFDKLLIICLAIFVLFKGTKLFFYGVAMQKVFYVSIYFVVFCFAKKQRVIYIFYFRNTLKRNLNNCSCV